ncbi:MAG TPA: outer membrane protein assembly factor BamD [Bacteroidota bacterium]|nr:outer membrane protein assembly factor BamD [Bacteroidota bacterium]
MNRSLLVLALGIAIALSLAGCSSSKEVEALPVEVRYTKAMAEFAKQDYLEAADDFKIVTVQYPGSSVADSAQFYIADCRYLRKEYILAASECDLLVRTMPSSPLVPRARYMKARSEYELAPQASLDQKYTREAIDDFQSFIEYFPTDSLAKDAAAKINELNDRLAKKDLDNGNLYYRLEYYRAAIVYYDIVLDRHHDSQYAADALFGKARALRQRYDDAAALDAINQFYTKFPTSDLKGDVDALKADILAQPSKHPVQKERQMGYSTVTPP